MLSELLPFVSETIVTMTANDRALSPQLMKKFAPKAVIASDAISALREAKSMSEQEDVIVITGSLYLVGECKAIINDIF